MNEITPDPLLAPPAGHYLLWSDEHKGYLSPKVRAHEFPDPLRCPPPTGQCDSQGLLIETRNVTGAGQRRAIYWQPIWDTVGLVRGAGTYSFFQHMPVDPPGAHYPNLSGHFSYPTAYTAWEIELVQYATDQTKPIGCTSGPKQDAQLSFMVGEHTAFRIQVEDMHKRFDRPRSLFASLAWPIHIPSVQNYRLIVQWPTDTPFEGEIRCILHGYVHREVV